MADLQSASFSHLDNPPLLVYALRASRGFLLRTVFRLTAQFPLAREKGRFMTDFPAVPHEELAEGLEPTTC